MSISMIVTQRRTEAPRETSSQVGCRSALHRRLLLPFCSYRQGSVQKRNEESYRSTSRVGIVSHNSLHSVRFYGASASDLLQSSKAGIVRCRLSIW